MGRFHFGSPAGNICLLRNYLSQTSVEISPPPPNQKSWLRPCSFTCPHFTCPATFERSLLRNFARLIHSSLIGTTNKIQTNGIHYIRECFSSLFDMRCCTQMYTYKCTTNSSIPICNRIKWKSLSYMLTKMSLRFVLQEVTGFQ